MEIKERRRVLVTEALPISRPTVTGLFETLEHAFKGKDKPVRVLYTKGEDLLIERTVLRAPDEDSSLLTPYQMVRQHAELEILSSEKDPVVQCCMASQSLQEDKAPLKFVVVWDFEALRTWLPKGVDLGKAFGVEVYVDPDAPESCIFFCGSAISPMIRDIERAICCRMV